MPVTYGGPSGKRLEDDDPRVARHRAIIANAGYGGGSPFGGQSSIAPIAGAPAQANSGSSGGKGGGRPDIDPSRVADSKLNKDKNYGYYRPDGTYVSAFVDMRDGGGKNQSGNYFVGGGLFSSLANALKVRPAGAARERNPETGEYIVPRSDIGYANVTDMFDRGGPQASGGKFQGAGGYSGMANFLYGLSGNEFGDRVPYGSNVQSAPTSTPTPMATPTPTPAPAPNYRFMYSNEVGRGVAPDRYGIGAGGEYAGTVPTQLVDAPTDDVNILEIGGKNLMNTQVLGTGRSVNTFGEQALRDKAIQLYGQAFNELTPSSQRLIIQGLMQGMVNAD